jgi:hypothetical protein
MCKKCGLAEKFGPVLECSTRLDHFIYKRKYLFCIKWSRLAGNSKTSLKWDAKTVRKTDTNCPVFECVVFGRPLYVTLLSFPNLQLKSSRYIINGYRAMVAERSSELTIIA